MFYISVAVNIALLILVIINLIKPHNSSINSKVDSIEKEIRELNNIFNRPYLRGEAGETLLRELLNNYLPKDSYQMQYSFNSGARVDAIIKTGKYIIPIDSKFPIESLKDILTSNSQLTNAQIKALVKHGEDIAKKYILPNEGTLNFAIMYIPSEKLYYQAFINDLGELTNKLLKMGILVCSPSTLFSLIQTVVYGLKGFTFNNKHNDIINKIEALRINYSLLEKQFNITNNHMKNLKQSMSLCEKLLDDSKELIPK
ncbi:MAG: DNA recombination protein RmuC [Spirochaetales bacterium]|nr:DNA recombination protein RmuC [Spirochaetales bacterium]